MTDERKAQGVGAQDTAKMTAAVILVVAGLVGYYSLVGYPLWMRWLAMLGGIVLGALVFMWSQYGRDFWQFVLDSRIELRKIVWPNRHQTGMTTLVVIIFTVIAGGFFWVLDLILAWATSHLTGQGG